MEGHRDGLAVGHNVEGGIEGLAVGQTDDLAEGKVVGPTEGIFDGFAEVVFDGKEVGVVDGSNEVGFMDGDFVNTIVGLGDGIYVGFEEDGRTDGRFEGVTVGPTVGPNVGLEDISNVGLKEGTPVG